MNNNAKYLVIDTETGGLTVQSSLLSVCFLTFDEDFNKRYTLNLFLKPDDEIYRVKTSALYLNKIDLIQHDKIAETYFSTKNKIQQFLGCESFGGRHKLQLIGKNVDFDLMFIFEYLYSKEDWEKYVSYRKIDISSLIQTLKIAGKLPPDISTSQESIAKFLGIENPKIHEAENDCIVTFQIFQKLLEMVK